MNLSFDQYNHEQPNSGVVLEETIMRGKGTTKLRSLFAFRNGTILSSHYFGETQPSTNKIADCLSRDVPDNKVVDPNHEKHMTLPTHKTFWETTRFFAQTASTTTSTTTATTKSIYSPSPLSHSSTPTLMPLTTEPSKQEETHMSLRTRKSFTETSNEHFVRNEDQQQESQRDHHQESLHPILSDATAQLISFVNERVNLFQYLDIDDTSDDDDDEDDDDCAEESASTSSSWSYQMVNFGSRENHASDVIIRADRQRDDDITALSSSSFGEKNLTVQAHATTTSGGGGGGECSNVEADKSSSSSRCQKKVLKHSHRQTASQQGDVIAVFEAALCAVGENNKKSTASSFAGSCGRTFLSRGRNRKLQQLYPKPRLLVDVVSC